MIAFAGLGYFVIGIVQLIAIMDYIELTLNLGFFDIVIACFATYIPILGSVLGILGAMDCWGWNIYQAGALFFWYVPVAFAFGLYGSLKRG